MPFDVNTYPEEWYEDVGQWLAEQVAENDGMLKRFVQSRVHEGDIAGHTFESTGWPELYMPRPPSRVKYGLGSDVWREADIDQTEFGGDA